MKPITLEEAKGLKHGTILYHTINCNADDTAERWRVNGKVQTWKRDPNKIRVPIKHGLKHCDYLTQVSLWLVSFWNWQKFSFASDAKKFRRQKQDEGYKTKIIHNLGVSNPFHVVYYIQKSNK